MGHRALVAYERPNGLYNLHYSHWGAHELQLNHSITPMTPFGGTESSLWASETIEALFNGDRTRYERLLETTNRPETSVRPDPMAVSRSFEEILSNRLDFLRYEAFFVVTPRYEITAYRTIWFGLEGYCDRAICCATIGNGALIAVDCDGGDPGDDLWIRATVAATKAVIGDMVDRGEFGLGEAREYLRSTLESLLCERTEGIVYGPTEPDVSK